jgi:Na+-transporting NADH:ubiquinone oxidoreductase subunit NqrB
VDAFRFFAFAPELISIILWFRTSESGSTSIAMLISEEAETRGGSSDVGQFGGFLEFVRHNVFVRDLRRSYQNSCLLCLAGAITLANNPKTRWTAIIGSFIWLIVLALTLDVSAGPTQNRKAMKTMAKKLKIYLLVGFAFSVCLKALNLLLT